MLYLDTSVLVAYYCPEPLSKKVEAIILKEKHPAIGLLTEVELFSAVSRKIREGHLDRADGRKIVAKYLFHADENFYTRIGLNSNHFILARDWIGQFETSLRTFDALHLAVAMSEGLMLVTGDRAFSKSAKALGLEVSLIS